MKALDIKEEIQSLIEKEDNLQILELIKDVLIKYKNNSDLKERLTARALKSEEDIKVGRVFSKEELEMKFEEVLGL
ncbi:hypothetical protein [Belliella pelovolcani]|uniref:hypothetical protein n=1 Tax=Belliella pelovolcani TaxID=529505 RepID=UPI003918F9E1